MDQERTETHIETTILGLVTEEDVVTTYDPAQYMGPATRACEGETWTSPSVMETRTSSMSGTTTEPTVPTDGVIESVDASITVEAGTFSCVVRKEVEQSGDEEDWWIRVWIDRATGIMVRSEIHDQAGAIRGDAELIELN